MFWIERFLSSKLSEAFLFMEIMYEKCLASVSVFLDWAGLDEDEDAHVWEDNWDDDNVEDDFSNQLRAELEKHGYKMETS